MGRWRHLAPRLERVLVLGERALLRWVGEPAGAGLFRDHAAFRWDAAHGAGRLVPVPGPQRFDLTDLLGVERSVGRLVRNTEQFVRGLPANHVLLYGERGTGKSSAVRGLLPRFAEQGLRLVEVRKADLVHLAEVVAELRGHAFRFLLFCDDLSFDEGEAGYRELKAALEGSLETPPPNVRIVATSNRRHLLPERISDSRGAHLDESGELHMGETVEEKLALSDRFGLLLGFFGFDQETYLRIVERYAAQDAPGVSREVLRADALRWALERSSRSGRTARQFVDDLAGRRGLERDSASRDREDLR